MSLHWIRATFLLCKGLPYFFHIVSTIISRLLFTKSNVRTCICQVGTPTPVTISRNRMSSAKQIQKDRRVLQHSGTAEYRSALIVGSYIKLAPMTGNLAEPCMIDQLQSDPVLHLLLQWTLESSLATSSLAFGSSATCRTINNSIWQCILAKEDLHHTTGNMVPVRVRDLRMRAVTYGMTYDDMRYMTRDCKFPHHARIVLALLVPCQPPVEKKYACASMTNAITSLAEI